MDMDTSQGGGPPPPVGIIPSSSPPIVAPPPPPPSQRSINQFEEWLRIISKFTDMTSSDEVRLKSLQDIMEQIDQILNHASYTTFLDAAIPVFTKYLVEMSMPEFVQEHPRHQCRKLVIEIIHRLPSNEPLRPHVKSIVSAMFKNVEKDNEENVVNCLRIIIELHKQFRPPLTAETQQFLNFVKTVFRDISSKMAKIFEQKPLLKVKDLSEETLLPYLDEIFAVTPMQNLQALGEKPKNLIPRACNSMKVLQELPIIVVLMYQIYKQSVQSEVAEYIPVIITTISLHPSELQRCCDIIVEYIFISLKTVQCIPKKIENASITKQQQ